jgi:serine/threonine protein kinase
MKSPQFRIDHKISESATTAVYRAFDEVLHRTVLLKVLHKHLATDDILKQRFVREARACAALHNEHIVQIYDLTEIDDAPAIVMEFVNGPSLKDYITDPGVRNFDTARKTAVHILRGLALAHDRGIIHRDIKPGNILVSEHGTMKVTDFGLAYVALSPTVTMEGMVLGTPAYMAPEQVRGNDIDARTDLFALGATIVEVLSGERIFEGSSYSECMKKVLAFKSDDLTKLEPLSSPDFVQFLIRLMHPDTQFRFASAREALDAIGEQMPHGHPPARSKESKKKFVPLAATFVFLLLLGIYHSFFLGEPPPQISAGVDSLQHAPADSAIIHQNTEQPQAAKIPAVKKAEEAPKRDQTEIRSVLMPDSGKVILTSTPWAKVYIDNQFIGETPIARPVILAAGTHTIMFMNPSFDPIVRSITVESNKESIIAGNFIDRAGYVLCSAIPWAEVYIDEQYKDTTPLTKPLVVSAGTHRFRFKNPAFSDIVKEAAITPQDTLRLTITFSK